MPQEAQEAQNTKLYVQNILKGPLVLSDLDITMEAFEPIDLSHRPSQQLRGSQSLRLALGKGLLDEISEEVYEDQLTEFDASRAVLQEADMERIEAEGLDLEGEHIDLGRGGRATDPHAKVDPARMAAAREKRDNDLTNPEVYARKYHEAANAHGLSPSQFAELDEQRQRRGGRTIEASGQYDPVLYAKQRRELLAQQQATVVTSDQRVVREPMGNFNRDGRLAGSEAEVVGFDPQMQSVGDEAISDVGTVDSIDSIDLGEDAEGRAPGAIRRK